MDRARFSQDFSSIFPEASNAVRLLFLLSLLKNIGPTKNTSKVVLTAAKSSSKTNKLVCMYVFMCVCMYVCMYVNLYLNTGNHQ